MSFPFELPDTKSSILKGVRNLDNEDAFGRFFDCYLPAFQNYFRSLNKDRDEADEWCQRFVLHLYTALPKVPEDIQRGFFRRYLVKTAKHFAIDRRRSNERRQKRFCPVPLVFDVQNLEQCIDHGTERYAIRLALMRTKDVVGARDWEIFHARVMEEKEVCNIAKEFSVSVAVVYKVVSRVRSRVKEALKDEEWV